MELKNYARGADIDSIDVDFQEILSRSVVDSTVNKVIFEKKIIEVPIHWDIAINKILNNNDLNRLIKTDTKYKSKFGKTYAGFDLFEDYPLIWFADNDTNNRAIRINGMQIFAVEVIRTYAYLRDGSPLLRNRIVYTNKTRSVLFQGGFGLQKSPDNGGSWKDDENNTYKENEISAANFPMTFVSIETPQYIIDNFETGNIAHDFGVIPCLEFLNKDVLDTQIVDRNLNDWYPAKEYIPLINSYLKYFAWEMNLDHTRLVGLFSQQDTKDIINTQQNLSPQQTLKRIMDNKHLEIGTDKVINQKLLLRSIGGADSKLEKMQSSLKGAEHIRALGEILDLAFKVCGYSWGTEENAVYENVSQTQNSNKRVYETTKEKIELFTRQWRELFCNIFYTLFNKTMGLSYSIHDVKLEFDKYVNFQIVSNVLQEQNNDWKKTLEVLKGGVISKETAFKFIYPDINAEELEIEMQSLQEEEEANKASEINEQFANRDFFGSENDKDNNDLAEKEPKGNE